MVEVITNQRGPCESSTARALSHGTVVVVAYVELGVHVAAAGYGRRKEKSQALIVGLFFFLGYSIFRQLSTTPMPIYSS